MRSTRVDDTSQYDVVAQGLMVPVRRITVGHVHKYAGRPQDVAVMADYLLMNPDDHLPPIHVWQQGNDHYRVFDGRHRFCAYVLAEREYIPVTILSDAHRARFRNEPS